MMNMMKMKDSAVTFVRGHPYVTGAMLAIPVAFMVKKANFSGTSKAEKPVVVKVDRPVVIAPPMGAAPGYSNQWHELSPWDKNKLVDGEEDPYDRFKRQQRAYSDTHPTHKPDYKKI